MAAIEVNVWCHECNTESSASLNEYHELECTECSSTFVEHEGQQIELFRSSERERNRRQINSSYNHDPGHNESSEDENDSSNSSLRSTVDNNVNGQPSISNLLSIVHSTLQSNPGRNIEILRPIYSQPIVYQHTIRPSEPSNAVGRTRNNNNDTSNGPTSIIRLVDSLIGGVFGGESNGEMSNNELENILHHLLMNENSRSGIPPLSITKIEALSRRTITEDDNIENEFGNECLISFEPFVIGDIVITLPCGHSYKEDQIVHWLEMHATCPVCRIALEREDS